jgi:hypothetical protein
MCAFIGFFYGIIKFFKPKKAVYAQMITLAVGSMAFGRLYQVVRLFTGDEIVEKFQLGTLGVIGSLLFLLTANSGLMDSLADYGSKRFLKYRIIPLAAPVFCAALYVAFVLFANVSNFAKIVGAVIIVVFISKPPENLLNVLFHIL